MFSDLRHVESIILMAHCGSEAKKWSLATTCGRWRVILGSKISVKTPFFDPIFRGVL